MKGPDAQPTFGHWGLWDCRGNCWLGNDKGPLTYEEKESASCAATITTEQFKRLIRPLLYTVKADKFKDEVTPSISAVEALKRIEKRTG